MTLDEMEAIAKKMEAIKQAVRELKQAEHKLELLNKGLDKGDCSIHSSWSTEIILSKAKNSYDDPVSVKIQIPFGVVQQQLVYAVDAARRKVIALGGMA